jgi:hypothetical protein
VNYCLNDGAGEPVRNLTDLIVSWLKENEKAQVDLLKLEKVNRNHICGIENS